LEAGGESVPVELGVPGEHMVANAVLAAAAGVEFGIAPAQIADALGSVTLTGGRLERRRIGGLEFLDDTYNANPDSVKAALKTLMAIETTGKRVAVLGRMAELGDREEADHEEIGRAASEAGVDLVIAVGSVADWVAQGAIDSGTEVIKAADQAEAGKLLMEQLDEGDLILVKGSRSSEMEKVIRIVGEAAEHS
jgi:UDP-N-acetylmuramyl pentapeptide synthase